MLYRVVVSGDNFNRELSRLLVANSDGVAAVHLALYAEPGRLQELLDGWYSVGSSMPLRLQGAVAALQGPPNPDHMLVEAVVL